jgi:glutamate dehydrogenase/leucine dehydrogenase
MREGQTLGYVAVDSRIRGQARGGLRIAADLSKEELRYASRAMTLKYGLLGLPQGGAKAGVVGDPDAPVPERRRRLRDFALAAGPLLGAGAYVPDADLGTDAADIRWMMRSIGMRAPAREWRQNRSGEHAARSCFVSAGVLRERKGSSLEGCRVAIEGFGKVGSALARLLRGAGAKVVAVSTSHGALHRNEGLDVAHLLSRASERGSQFVTDESGAIRREALLELPVDLLCLCARHHSIHAGNVHQVTAPVICAGANDPVAPTAERVLLERDVSYPPDFVTNCGGVLGGTLEFAGVSARRIGALIDEHVRAMFEDLLDRADQRGVAVRSLAEDEALARHARVRAGVEEPHFGHRLRTLALEAYRRRLIPKRPVALLAARSVPRWMA